MFVSRVKSAAVSSGVKMRTAGSAGSGSDLLQTASVKEDAVFLPQR